MIKSCCWLSLVFLIAGCASEPEKKQVADPVPVPVVAPVSGLDLKSLEQALHMDREAEELGYQEAPFNTCQVGYGFSPTHDCRDQFLVSVHYKLQCRNSEGTISEALTENDLKAVGDQDITWTLTSQRGLSRTSSSGHGQILAVFPSSQRSRRLKLATRGEFLYLRAEEIKRIVAPGPWCQ